jgi:putative hydrolase of the HAD superfamily
MNRFQTIDTWVFDLDNTLYPASCRLFDQIDVRMGQFVSRLLNIPYAEAKQRQKELYYKHGTTLRGLMMEHKVDPGPFLSHAHNIDYAPVKPDEALARAITALPGRKLVFTNGTVSHAKAVMNNIGITSLFDGIFDIIHADYIPKPARAPYDVFLERHSVNPAQSAFFEDIAHNLKVPHDMGMATVLITHEDNGDARYLNEGADGSHVHFKTNDLATFLRQCRAPG